MKIKFLAIIIMLHTLCFADNPNKTKLEDIHKPPISDSTPNGDSPGENQSNDNWKTDFNSQDTFYIFTKTLDIDDQVFNEKDPWD